MNKEDEEAATVGRRRRSVHSINNKVVELPRDMKNIVDQYLDWRRNNGYGRLIRRWGK